MPEKRMYYTRRTMLLLLGFCMLPLAGLLLSAMLAGLLGCELSEGGAQACTVLGLDISGFLNTLFVGGWLALITMPLMAVVVAIWIFIEGGSHWRKRRKARKLAAPESV